MKAVQSTLFVSILTLLLGVSVPAQADPSLQPNALSAHDLELLFEQDGEPVQLALLSPKEMGETKAGTLLSFIRFYYAFGKYAFKLASLRGKIEYHVKPHNFKKGILKGRRSHLQFTWWFKGHKGSQHNHRIAIGPKHGNPNPRRSQ